MTNSLLDSGRAEKIMAYLRETAFDFYAGRFTLENILTEEAKDFTTLKTESEIMREAFSIRNDESGPK